MVDLTLLSTKSKKLTLLFEESKSLFASPTVHISVKSKERRKY